MSKSPTFLLLLMLSSLMVLTLGLSATLQGSYFYVPKDNHLSYEIYQTRFGAIAHSIEPTTENTYASTYALIDLNTKDAVSILSDLVSSCDLPNPTFQSLHYHAQTDTLVYYCAKSSSLLILNQWDQSVQQKIPVNLQASLPVAKLSTDGVNVVILFMDTLFTQSPQNSVLIKVDIQSRQVVSQISFNEAVVAYAAGKDHAYIATNSIQGTDSTTVVSSIVVTENTYQLTQFATFNSFNVSSKVITKLFCLEDYVVVNNGTTLNYKNELATALNFLSQQGTVVKSVKITIKSLTNQSNGLFHPAVTAQYGGANLYLLDYCITSYFVNNNSLQSQELFLIDFVEDLQIAFGSPTTASQDLIFTLGQDQIFFYIFEAKTFKRISQVPSGYTDVMLTDTTYGAVRQHRLDLKPRTYIFNLETHALLTDITMEWDTKHYYNKDQNFLSYLGPITAEGCHFVHIHLVSQKRWIEYTFGQKDPICNSSVAYARIANSGDIDAVFRLPDHYVIYSSSHDGKLFFPRTSDTDSINVNFDDLSLSYLSANQATNQITASLCAFNSTINNFSLISTTTLDNHPVENEGFFISNQTTTVALSDTSFAVINKLNSIWSEENFSNHYNMLTTFKDNANTQFTLFGYNNSALAKGDAPQLFSSSKGLIEIPNKRVSTVNGKATGTNSFALHDDLKPIGVVRIYKSDSTGKEAVSM